MKGQTECPKPSGYEAVLEMVPDSTDGKWITWVINISPKSNYERDDTTWGWFCHDMHDSDRPGFWMLRTCWSLEDRESCDLSSAHSSATTQLSIYRAPLPCPQDVTPQVSSGAWTRTPEPDATTAMALRQPNELLLVIIKHIMKPGIHQPQD